MSEVGRNHTASGQGNQTGPCPQCGAASRESCVAAPAHACFLELAQDSGVSDAQMREHLSQLAWDEYTRWRLENERLRSALEELLNAGEPFVGDAFPAERLNGHWLRIFNRWQAAMNDGRGALSSSVRDQP